MYRKNTAGQFIYFCLINSTTGAALTGATVTAYRALDNGAQATATGTTTELANGHYRFNLSQADTNADNGSFLFTATNAVAVEKTCVFTSANPSDSIRFGLTALPNANAGAAGGLPTDSTGKTSFNDLSASGVRSAVGMAAANLDTQLSGIQSDTTTLTGRLTASRALYLDNLNVGGPVASQADINALNQSASRRLILTTLQQLERPETGSTSYQIEARTFDGDGAAVNADSTPTLTATGTLSGSLSANLSAATNPATGVYRWTYSVANNATQEQIRFDLSATIATTAFSISAFAAVVDLVSATWTSTDASRLAAIYNKLPSRAYLTGATAATGELVPGDILNQLPSGGWTSGSFGDRLLVAANNNRTAFLTGSQHIAADVHAFQPAVIDSAALAASAITAIQSGLATSTALATAQADLDDIQTRLPAALVGGLMASISQQLGTTAENQVNAQVLDVLAVDLFTELNAVPAASSSLKDKITFLFMLARNKVTQDTTTFRLFADNTTTQVASASVGDVGSVFTRGELA